MRTASSWALTGLLVASGCFGAHAPAEPAPDGGTADLAGSGAAGAGGAAGTAGTGGRPTQGDAGPMAGGSAPPSAAGPDGGALDGSSTALSAGDGANPGPQVWIGELWSVVPSLCDPETPWSDETLIVQPTGYRDRVVLILATPSDAPEGVIVFGAGELDVEAAPPPPTGDESGSFWLCAVQVPSAGGRYTLMAARRTSARLSFDIVPAEALDPACASGEPGCLSCQGLACELAGQRLHVDLSVSGDEMQGTLPGGGFGTPAELRMRRCPGDCSP